MIVKKKAPTDMKATRQHKNFLGRSEAHQTSYQYRIIKAVAKATKVLAIAIGALAAIVAWVVIRPVIRGIGWIISIVTAALIALWLITNL